MRLVVAFALSLVGVGVLFSCGDPHSYAGGGRDINHLGAQTAGGDGGTEGGGSTTTKPPPVVDSGGPGLG